MSREESLQDFKKWMIDQRYSMSYVNKMINYITSFMNFAGYEF